MGDADNYRELAEALSPSFSVYSADRRGRGLSPKIYDTGHTIARDVEDIDAILAQTGAGYVFGLVTAGTGPEVLGLLPRPIARLLGHDGPWDESRGGRPHDVAAALRPSSRDT